MMMMTVKTLYILCLTPLLLKQPEENLRQTLRVKTHLCLGPHHGQALLQTPCLLKNKPACFLTALRLS